MLGCAQCLAPKTGSVNSREGEGREIQMGGDVCIPMADYFANKGPSSQGYGFSCGHVWM